MEYKKRTCAPNSTDKNYLHYSKGGYNTCIVVDKTTGRVLPNCVGYAQGRLLEIMGAKSVNWKLPACNPDNWISTAKRNGLQTGNVPKLGAVAVWSGHVAVVEEIKEKGDIVCSNSAFNGTEYYVTTHTKSSNYSKDGNVFMGFVYCGIEFESVTSAQPEQPQIKYKVYDNSGKQLNAYANLNYALVYAQSVGGIVIEVATGKQIYPALKTLTANSYPDYTDGQSYYRVAKKPNSWITSKGSFSKFANAYKQWMKYKELGYHLYDKNWKQLDDIK